MIDTPAYESEYAEELEEIRSGAGYSQGITSASSAVQEQFRSREQQSRETSGLAGDRGQGSRNSERSPRATSAASQGRDSREGRADSAPDQGGRGANSHRRPADGTLSTSAIKSQIAGLYHRQPDIRPADAAKELNITWSTAKKYLTMIKQEEQDYHEEEDRPAGIIATPHAAEEAIRKQQRQAEQDQQRQASQQESRGGVRGWFHRDHSSRDKGKPLSDKEAESIKPALIAALLDYFRYADELIYATHRMHKQVQIWSSIDDEEAGMLVDVWLARARRSATSARHIQLIIDRHQELRVGIILAPRFYATFRAYVDGGGIGVR